MEKFNNLLQGYYEFKKKHSPYDYREWRVGGEIVKDCKNILDQIAEHIKAVLIQKMGLRAEDFTVTSASGTGYYPKSPWIGIFKNGECATDGVYPVLGFYNDSDGCFIGCVESFTNPQFGFQSEYCRNDGLSDKDKRSLENTGLDNDTHLARMPKIFEASSEISENCLIEALTSALDIHKKYREKYPRRSSIDIDRENDTVSTSTWYKEIHVDDVSKWLGFVTSPPTQTNDRESWIFRGQGDASWHLESLLYRYFGSIGDGADIKAIETNAIAAFKRETYDSSLCQRLTGVNILAVMQHYGSATRLLDFTYAPLTALFFAIEQRDTLLSNARSYCKTHATQLHQIYTGISQNALDDNVSLAVWAFKLRSILGMSDCDLDLALAKSTKDAHSIVLHGSNRNYGSSDKDSGTVDNGIDVVVPKFGNERLSAQSGLFLMARNIGKPFEENLRVALPNLTTITEEDCRRENISAIRDWDDVIQKFSVVKFVFPPIKVRELKIMLKSLHITYKTIYPDLMGIAKDVTAET